MPNAWNLYEQRTSFVIGFHGCRKTRGEEILTGQTRHLKKSEKKWDWLGSGIYFWEGNPERAQQWAIERYGDEAFIVGAVIDLGRCLDLLDSAGLQQVHDAFDVLKNVYDAALTTLPKNEGKDKGARKLDCLVLNSLHTFRADEGLPSYDSVRAMFPEGKELYDDAGFMDKNHIQLCIRNPDCIKGYFRPIPNK